MMCTNNKNTCSGCSNEASWHRRTHLLERDILTQSTPNERLASVLKWLHTPTLLKTIRQGLSYLPTFQSTKRDDHIFGATRYLAHSVAPAPSLYSSYLHLCLTPAQDAQFNAHGKSRATMSGLPACYHRLPQPLPPTLLYTTSTMAIPGRY